MKIGRALILSHAIKRIASQYFISWTPQNYETVYITTISCYGYCNLDKKETEDHFTVL